MSESVKSSRLNSTTEEAGGFISLSKFVPTPEPKPYFNELEARKSLPPKNSKNLKSEEGTIFMARAKGFSYTENDLEDGQNSATSDDDDDRSNEVLTIDLEDLSCPRFELLHVKKRLMGGLVDRKALWGEIRTRATPATAQNAWGTNSLAGDDDDSARSSRRLDDTTLTGGTTPRRQVVILRQGSSRVEATAWSLLVFGSDGPSAPLLDVLPLSELVVRLALPGPPPPPPEGGDLAEDPAPSYRGPGGLERWHCQVPRANVGDVALARLGPGGEPAPAAPRQAWVLARGGRHQRRALQLLRRLWQVGALAESQLLLFEFDRNHEALLHAERVAGGRIARGRMASVLSSTSPTRQGSLNGLGSSGGSGPLFSREGSVGVVGGGGGSPLGGAAFAALGDSETSEDEEGGDGGEETRAPPRHGSNASEMSELPTGGISRVVRSPSRPMRSPRPSDISRLSESISRMSSISRFRRGSQQPQGGSPPSSSGVPSPPLASPAAAAARGGKGQRLRPKVSGEALLAGVAGAGGGAATFFARNKALPVGCKAHRLLRRAHARLWAFEPRAGERLLAAAVAAAPAPGRAAARAWALWLRAEARFLQCFLSGDARALGEALRALDLALAAAAPVYASGSKLSAGGPGGPAAARRRARTAAAAALGQPALHPRPVAASAAADPTEGGAAAAAAAGALGAGAPPGWAPPDLALQLMLLHAQAACLKVLLLMWMNRPMKAVWLGRSLVKHAVAISPAYMQIGPMLAYDAGHAARKLQRQAAGDAVDEGAGEGDAKAAAAAAAEEGGGGDGLLGGPSEAAVYAGECWQGAAHHLRFLSGLLHAALSTLPEAVAQLLGRLMGLAPDFDLGQELLRQASAEAGLMAPLAAVFLNVFLHIQEASPAGRRPFPEGGDWLARARERLAAPEARRLPLLAFLRAKALFQTGAFEEAEPAFRALAAKVRREGAPFPLHLLAFYAAQGALRRGEWGRALSLAAGVAEGLRPFSAEMHLVRLSAAAHAAALEPASRPQARQRWMELALRAAAEGRHEGHPVARRLRAYLERGAPGRELWLFELLYLLHPARMASLGRAWHLRMLAALDRDPTTLRARAAAGAAGAAGAAAAGGQGGGGGAREAEVDALALNLYLRAVLLNHLGEEDQACALWEALALRPPTTAGAGAAGWAGGGGGPPGNGCGLRWSAFVHQNALYHHALRSYKRRPTYGEMHRCAALLDRALALPRPPVHDCARKAQKLRREFAALGAKAGGAQQGGGGEGGGAAAAGPTAGGGGQAAAATAAAASPRAKPQQPPSSHVSGKAPPKRASPPTSPKSSAAAAEAKAAAQ